jgi:Uncharacterised nucleotidyltransferase
VAPLRRWHDWRVTSSSAAARDGLWSRVDELIDRAPSMDDLRSHRLEPLAAKHFRRLGRPVPDDFTAEARGAAVASLAAPLLLERVHAVYGGPAIVLKGPEVAAAYPDPSLRRYGDVDVLVHDAPAVQHALIDAGFEPVGDPRLYVDIHHLRPLAVSGIPLHLELHTSPKWLDGRNSPSAAELFAEAIPSQTNDGMLTLAPGAHALVLAAHSWAHEPFRRLRDLIDIAAIAANADLDEIDLRAADWGIQRLWRTTIATVDSLFYERGTPWALRLWAQNLARVRERTVLENHLQRLLSDFWAFPLHQALSRVPRRLSEDIRPEPGEGWRSKLSRSGLALRNASRPRSRHDRQLDDRDAHSDRRAGD